MSDARGEKPARSRRRRWAVVAACLCVIVVVWASLRGPPAIEPGTVLVLDLESGLAERAPGSFEQLLGASSFDLLGLHNALGAALTDDRVDGLLVRLGSSHLGGAVVEEISMRLEDVRRAGKFVVAYTSDADTLNYVLATAADEIIQDATTTLNTTGLGLTAFFLKDLLEKYGAKADLIRVGKYKGTFEQFTLSEPTASFSTAMDGLADSLFASVVKRVAATRSLEAGAVRALIDRSPLTAGEALDGKLVDRVMFSDELEAHLQARLHDRGQRDLHLLPVADYASRVPAETGERHIAVVRLLGTITEGESRNLVLTGEVCGAATIVRALETAADQPDVVGILLRIDSPGGLVTASEKVWRAVERASKKKPVVASFGNTAASGGYYAACAADKVLAHGLSLTGSIGVFGGKVVLKDLLQRHGINVRSYPRGHHATMFDFDRPFQPDERLHLGRLLEVSYRTFVDRVKTRRSVATADIESVAEGRVWSGVEAREIGLVDALGGLSAAESELRRLAGVPADVRLGLRAHPSPPTLWDFFTGDPREELAAARTAETRSAVALLRAWLDESGLFRSARGLALMPFGVELR